ncbi:MAG: helix-turn-helix domain-containing protein [Clostridiales bacterium]|nr:helix-turn-helix domain-containing protein [Clostridiales bacterium]
MQQELKERCLQYCKHIEVITGTTCVMMDIRQGCFGSTPFSHTCELPTKSCNAFTTHLYGAYEAERWDDKYIYYCPRGLIFIATPVRTEGSTMEYCLITGPIIMSNFPNDDRYGEITYLDGLENVPCMTTAETRSLSEIIRATCGYIGSSQATPDVDSGSHAEMLQMMYDISRRAADENMTYPLDSERELQHMIKEGDKEGSQKLLNELLGYVYFYSGANFKVVKSRVNELLVIMSRAAIEGGADINEVFWLNNNYIEEVEKFKDIESLSRWVSAVMHKFVSCVFDLSEAKHRDIVFKITVFIKQRLNEKLTIGDAADHVYLSKSHLSRILRQGLGCTFTEHVNRLRIDRSKILLIDSRLSVSDISGKVGFDDQGYYTRVFKKNTGLTPSEYREQNL